MNESRLNYVDWKTTLLGKLLLLAVLSKVTQTNPEKEWLQSLIDEDVFSESPLERNHPDVEGGLGYLQRWAQENKNDISDEHLTALKADYTRLFIGIGKPVAPPWESVYFNEDRLIFQEQTLQVRDWYRRFGLEPEMLYKEPDDHVGLELAFLAHLARLGLEVLEENNETEFEQILQAQRQFISEHALRWIPHWCGLVEKHAKTDFYRGLSQLIRGTLYALAESLGVQAAEGRKL